MSMLRNSKDDLSYELVRELLDYDGKNLIWREHRGRVAAGSIAGSIDTKGYRVIGINKRDYFAHRLVWLWWYGRWPQGEIDHANRDPLDNRVENLREATRSQNKANSKYRMNKSGYKGVQQNGSTKSWRAQISWSGRIEYIGYFKTKEEAYEAYCKRARELFGDFARLPQGDWSSCVDHGRF